MVAVILNIRIRLNYTVIHTLRPLYPRKKSHRYPFSRRLWDRRTDMGDLNFSEKRKISSSSPNLNARSFSSYVAFQL